VRGGERLAVAYTLVDNCIILGIDPRRYLQDTIDKLERGHALSRMSELTPASWAASPIAALRTDSCTGVPCCRQVRALRVFAGSLASTPISLMRVSPQSPFL